LFDPSKQGEIFGGVVGFLEVELALEAEGFFIGIIENRQPLEGFGLEASS